MVAKITTTTVTIIKVIKIITIVTTVIIIVVDYYFSIMNMLAIILNLILIY